MKRSGFVLTHRGAGVPDEVRANHAAEAADHRHVPRLAAEIGREPAGEPVIQGEAAGVGCDGGQRVAVGHVVNDRHGRAIAGVRDSGFGPLPVAHQQRLSAVRAEDAATRVRVAEEKPARHPLAREVGVGVGLKTAVGCVAEVAEELDIAVHFRRAPDLGRVRQHVGVARRAERGGIAAGRAPVGRIRAAVFQAEIGETAAAQRQADVGCHAVGFPSPSRCVPAFNDTAPPEAASFNWKFMTPAMASEPYWAAAPSRNTSTCRSAMAGIAEMSGPWEPKATPLPPCQSMIAERWRRLPFTRTSVWSGARFRSIAGRTTVEASLMGCVLTLNEGTTVRSCSCRLKPPCRVRSDVERMSTGTVEAVTVRASAREPTTAASPNSGLMN